MGQRKDAVDAGDFDVDKGQSRAKEGVSCCLVGGFDTNAKFDVEACKADGEITGSSFVACLWACGGW